MKVSRINIRNLAAEIVSLVSARQAERPAAVTGRRNALKTRWALLLPIVMLLLTAVFSSPQVPNQDRPQAVCPLCRPPDNSVLTHHNNIARTGAQLAEWTLSPQSIKGKGGLVVTNSASMTGVVWGAQPLFVQGVPLKNGPDDLVFVVDSTNTVYAFSPANALAPVAVRNLEPATDGSTVDPVGILSTPAIDQAQRLMYLVARAPDFGAPGNAKFILHVLDWRRSRTLPLPPQSAPACRRHQASSHSFPGWRDNEQRSC